MKRILILLCLFTISFSIVATSENEPREFITGFFQAIKGNDWKLNPDCFGPASHEKFGDLLYALKSADWTRAYSIFSTLETEAKQNCPFDDLLELKNRLNQEIAEGKLFDDLRSNSSKIISILTEIFHLQQRTPYDFGKALGSIASMVLYQKKHNSFAFLALSEEAEVFLDVDVKLKSGFFKGLLTGVSAVPYEQNKCYQEIDGSLDEIEAAVMKIYNAVVSRDSSNFTAALAQLTVSLLKIKAYDEDCRVTQLIKSLSVYSAGYAGLAKLIYNITTNRTHYYDLSQEMIQAIREMNLEKGGVTCGKIVKILLSWETK